MTDKSELDLCQLQEALGKAEAEAAMWRGLVLDILSQFLARLSMLGSEADATMVKIMEAADAQPRT